MGRKFCTSSSSAGLGVSASDECDNEAESAAANVEDEDDGEDVEEVVDEVDIADDLLVRDRTGPMAHSVSVH